MRLALAAVAMAAAIGSAHADGRGGPAVASVALPATGSARRAQHSDVLAEASRWIGRGKFTPFPGPWCADAISAWLRATGHRPLANRMAASALSYGPHLRNPEPGAIAVMSHHVGLVEGVEPDGSIRIISGNWDHRVARAVVPRWQITAFIGV